MDEGEAQLVASIALAQSGDPEAFYALLRRFGKPVLSFVYHLVGDRSHAEELAQEVFVRAFRALGSMRNPQQFSTWLFGIARNVVRESVKAKYRRTPNVALDDPAALALADNRSGPDENLAASELGRTIRHALSCLPVDFRVVFILKVLHRMSYEEISGVTGSSVGKLKTDLHRARAEMRRRLIPYLEGSGRMRGKS